MNIKTINMTKGRFRRPKMHKSQALILKCNNNGCGDVGGWQGLILEIFISMVSKTGLCRPIIVFFFHHYNNYTMTMTIINGRSINNYGPK
jgi:hypothetical protein